MDNKCEASKHKTGSEPLRHLATAQNEIEAEFLAGVLEDNGIHCLLKKEGAIAGILGGYSLSSPFIPCEIYVLASKEEEAKGILDSLREGDQVNGSDSPPSSEL
jgi:hypothetical protein